MINIKEMQKQESKPLSSEYDGEFLIKPGTTPKNRLIDNDKDIIKDIPKKQQPSLSTEYDGEFIKKPPPPPEIKPVIKEEPIAPVLQNEKNEFELKNLEEIYKSQNDLKIGSLEANNPKTTIPFGLIGIGILLAISIAIAKSSK